MKAESVEVRTFVFTLSEEEAHNLQVELTEYKRLLHSFSQAENVSDVVKELHEALYDFMGPEQR